MVGQTTFFSCTKDTWQNYGNLRNKYSDAIPVPQRSYFNPLRSIDHVATSAVRLVEKPIWLALHTIGFLLKGIISLALSIVLAPPALLLTLIAPHSELGYQTNSLFKLAAAQTLVSTGMAGIALISTVLALLLNPVSLMCRAASTVVDSVNSLTESCCGLTIAKL